MWERFAEQNIYHLKFNIPLPSQVLKHDVNDLAHKLNQCWVIKNRLMWEIFQYKQTSTNALKNLDSVLQSLAVCLSPTLHTLYEIFVCLPVSIAVERSFSTLRRTKSRLRSTMKEDRLNGLAMLNTHLDIDCPCFLKLDMWLDDMPLHPYRKMFFSALLLEFFLYPLLSWTTTQLVFFSNGKCNGIDIKASSN